MRTPATPASAEPMRKQIITMNGTRTPIMRAAFMSCASARSARPSRVCLRKRWVANIAAMASDDDREVDVAQHDLADPERLDRGRAPGPAASAAARSA